jgi:hypothetical protein
MPYSIARRLGVGDIRPTSVSLQMADRSISLPRGILEDVLVKVDKFILPADFIIIDIEEDRHMPIILGRPFLATAGAYIDVKAGDLKFRINGEEVKFNIFSEMRQPDKLNVCSTVNTNDRSASKYLHSSDTKDPMKEALAKEAKEPIKTVQEIIRPLENIPNTTKTKVSSGSDKKSNSSAADLKQKGKEVEYICLVENVENQKAHDPIWKLENPEKVRIREYEDNAPDKKQVDKRHDIRILLETLRPGQQVSLIRSKKKLAQGKYKSKWVDPLVVITDFPCGAVEVQDPKTGRIFEVKRQMLRAYPSKDFNLMVEKG